MRWISTPNSVRKNQPTCLAILETLLAVALYWGIAWAFDTHWHLLVSICVAPLLLLRSEESTEKGVRWFVAYWKDRTEITLRGTPARFWTLFLLTVSITAACLYGLVQILLVGQADWALLVRVIGLVVLILMIVLIVATTVPGATVKAIAGARAGTVAEALTGTGAGAGARIFAILLFLIPVAVGVWLRSLGVRVLATLRHPIRGLKALPGNWWRLLLAIDLVHAPELAPGLSAHDGLPPALSLSRAGKAIRAGNWSDRLLYSPLIPIWFLPGLLYRWSLKSTCWLYLPLIYLGGGLRWRPHTPKEKRLLVASLHKSPEQSIRRWLAIGVAVSLIITTALNYPTLQAEIQASLSDAPKSMKSFLWFLERLEHVSLPYLWAFDLFDLAPWQWLNLLGAVLTGGLWIYGYRVNLIWTLAKDLDANASPEEGHITRLLWMVRARNLCAIFYVFLAFGYVALALGSTMWGLDGTGFTGWLGWLGALYGPYL